MIQGRPTTRPWNGQISMLEICAKVYLWRVAWTGCIYNGLQQGIFFITGRLRRLIQDTEQLSNPLVFWSARTDGSFARKNVQQKKWKLEGFRFSRFHADHQQLQRSRRIEMLIEVSWFWSVSPVELWWAGAQFQSVRFPDAFVSIDKEKVWTSFESKSKSLVCETELAFKACLQDNRLHRILQKLTIIQSWENISPVFGSFDFWGSVFCRSAMSLEKMPDLGTKSEPWTFSEVWENILDRIVFSYSYRGIFSLSFNSKIASCHK